MTNVPTSSHGFTVVAVDMEIFAVFGAVWGIIVDTVWVVCLVDAAGVILVDAVWFIVVDGIWAILVDAACDADVYKQTKSFNNRKTVKTVKTLT
jgi:hypothetical protein